MTPHRCLVCGLAFQAPSHRARCDDCRRNFSPFCECGRTKPRCSLRCSECRRLDGLTDGEHDFLMALRILGDGPVRSDTLMAYLGKSREAVNQERSRLARRGRVRNVSHEDCGEEVGVCLLVR